MMPSEGVEIATARGEAGRLGDGVRSDLHVRLELVDEGGIQVELTSKVDSLYGGSIRETTETVLKTLGVENVRVTIVDNGALPFVIAARVEAAARRAGVPGSAPPKASVECGERSSRDQMRRSRLYLPGNEPKFMINAGIHRPDSVILDLEDSVHPDQKDAARLVVRNALRSVDFQGAERMVRINQVPLGMDDLEAVVPERPDLILIPKVENAAEVRDVHNRIRQLAGDEHPIWLMPILETALGVENAFDIAGAAETVVGLTIGLEDYTADLGVRKTLEGNESLYARMRLVNAARAAGLQAIDSVFGDVGDIEGLRDWGKRSRALGFEGMGCIHPRQILPIHEVFTPSSSEIERALEIVTAFNEAESRGLGVVSLGTRMIDPPVVLRARRLVESARQAGLVTDEGDSPP